MAQPDSPRQLTNFAEFVNPLGKDAHGRTVGRHHEIFAAEPELFWAPINSVEDVLADDQFHAAGGVVYVPDGDSTVPMIASPADFSGTPWAPRSTAPQLGEHTAEVLAELSDA
ncbi:CoA transferase [Mycolicibacterium elephantis]|uniref:CoA transferase n=1 Tax=Mycolicibacterium elephantis TaxID=81858 RepID=UPI000A01896A|nr:CoA transferase [Mycolicibacterium elephantis]